MPANEESPDLTRGRQGLEADPELPTLGPQGVLYAILDEVVDEYEPVVAGLGNHKTRSRTNCSAP